jgi:hypothetical protein
MLPVLAWARAQFPFARKARGAAVRFPGRCTDARSVMAGRDLAVLSSHLWVETLPLALIEAMDAGIPVVSTRVGALPNWWRTEPPASSCRPATRLHWPGRFSSCCAIPSVAPRWAAAGRRSSPRAFRWSGWWILPSACHSACSGRPANLRRRLRSPSFGWLISLADPADATSSVGGRRQEDRSWTTRLASGRAPGGQVVWCPSHPARTGRRLHSCIGQPVCGGPKVQSRRTGLRPAGCREQPADRNLRLRDDG